MIKAIEDKEKKINDYKVYTNTYTNFDWFQLSHLFELYNWYFIENCDKLEYILIDLANILFSLYKRTNQININENKKSDIFYTMNLQHNKNNPTIRKIKKNSIYYISIIYSKKVYQIINE